MPMKIETVSNRRCKLAEGPHWDPKTNELLHVDILGGDVCKLNPETRLTESRHIGGMPSMVVPIIPRSISGSHKGQQLLVSLDKKLGILDWDSGKLKVVNTLDDGIKGNRFNDGKCDSTGRLWLGTMALVTTLETFQNNLGAFYQVGSNFKFTKKLCPVSLSNGIAWSSDNKAMFYIDTMARRIDAFDFNAEQGLVENQRVLVDFKDEPAFPDGMTIDVNNHLWVAFYNGAKVVEVDSETGRLLSTIILPADQITSCCFGGPNLTDLYVTSAADKYTDEQLRAQPEAGAIFRISELGTKGLPANNFVM